VIGISALLLWEVVRSANPENRQPSEITYSQFMSDVDAGKVATVTITGVEIRGRYRDTNSQFHLTGPSNQAVYVEHLRSKDVEIRFRDASSASLPLQLLGTWAPLILLGALWIYMIRRMQGRTQPPTSRRADNAPIEPK
jgi:cell division protease FtsH